MVVIFKILEFQFLDSIHVAKDNLLKTLVNLFKTNFNSDCY